LGITTVTPFLLSFYKREGLLFLFLMARRIPSPASPPSLDSKKEGEKILLPFCVVDLLASSLSLSPFINLDVLASRGFPAQTLPVYLKSNLFSRRSIASRSHLPLFKFSFLYKNFDVSPRHERPPFERSDFFFFLSQILSPLSIPEIPPLLHSLKRLLPGIESYYSDSNPSSSMSSFFNYPRFSDFSYMNTDWVMLSFLSTGTFPFLRSSFVIYPPPRIPYS